MNAPIVVNQYPYTVTVARGVLYRMSVFSFGTPEPVLNSFLDPTLPLVMGRALVLACAPERSDTYLGWDWRVGMLSNVGWLVFDGKMVNALPLTVMSGAAGYELGVALSQLGAMLQLRLELSRLLSTLTEQKVG